MTEASESAEGSRASEDPQPRPQLRLLRTAGLAVGYGGRAILPSVDITVHARELWAVLGPNGAGKSTFVRTLLGLERPIRGSIDTAPELRACYVPQQANLDPIFPVRVLEFVLMGAISRERLWGRARDEEVAAARTALEEVRGADLEQRLLRDLSGGQRQRVLLARALVAGANLYVHDEPTAALDVTSEREILDLVGSLAERRGAAVMMITHMVEEALHRANRILFLDREHGVALSASPRDIVKSPALQRLYGPVSAETENPR